MPKITGLTPNAAVVEGAAFDLNVFGTDFVDGATVLWNGEPQPTVWVSATELWVAIPASAMVVQREVYIRVNNPAPNLGISNLMPLQIQSQKGALLSVPNSLMYLPIVAK